MSRRVFFSFLGTTAYTPVRYAFRGALSSTPESFVQAPLLGWVAPDGDIDVRIGVTREVRARGRWKALEERLSPYSARLRPVEVDLQDDSRADEGPGHDEERLWALFDRIGQEFAPGDEVHFDVTHGFRSLPIMALLALTFFSRVRGFTLGGIYYGAFESLLNRDLASDGSAHFKSPFELDLWCRDSIKDGPVVRAPNTTAPVFDLTAMFALTAWTDGVSEWQRTGRADGLVARAAPLTDALKAQLRADAPKDLVGFPEALRSLSDALTSVRHDLFASSANRVKDRLDGMAVQARLHPALAPLRALGDSLRDDVLPLTVDFTDSDSDWSQKQVVTDAYLRHQIAVARWLAGRRRVVESFTVLREAITSCAVRVALAAGLSSIAGDKDETDRFRDRVDGWCQVRSGANGANRRPDAPDALQPARDALCAFLEARPGLTATFRKAIESVRTHRNRFDHAWTGHEHSRSLPPKTRIEVALKDLDEAAQSVEALVGEVSALASPPPPSSAHACFVNLSNHAVAGWSAPQREAALALDLGAPEDIDGAMPLVPPDEDEDAIQSLAASLADRAVAQGARGAHVATDYTLTVALVAALRARGVRCFAATTTRQTRDVLRDGTIVKESAFGFVRWREYR